MAGAPTNLLVVLILLYLVHSSLGWSCGDTCNQKTKVCLPSTPWGAGSCHSSPDLWQQARCRAEVEADCVRRKTRTQIGDLFGQIRKIPKIVHKECNNMKNEWTKHVVAKTQQIGSAVQKDLNNFKNQNLAMLEDHLKATLIKLIPGGYAVRMAAIASAGALATKQIQSALPLIDGLVRDASKLNEQNVRSFIKSSIPRLKQIDTEVNAAFLYFTQKPLSDLINLKSIIIPIRNRFYYFMKALIETFEKMDKTIEEAEKKVEELRKEGKDVEAAVRDARKNVFPNVIKEVKEHIEKELQDVVRNLAINLVKDLIIKAAFL